MHFFQLKKLVFVFLSRGTVEDTELIDGLVLDQKTTGYDGPKKIEKTKIALIQFCISPPKTDVGAFLFYVPPFK